MNNIEKKSLIRIAFVECSSGFGGSAKCVYQFASAIDITKYSPYIYCSNVVGWFESLKQVSSCVVTATHIKPTNEAQYGNRFKYIFKMADILLSIAKFPYFLMKFKEHKINIVHTNNNIYEHIPAFIAAKLLSVPIICHLHDQTPLTSIEKIFIPLIDKFFVLSSVAKNIYLADIPASKIQIIRNGLLVKDYEKITINDNLVQHLAVGVVGRLISWKGQETLIRAAALIIKIIPDVKFYIIGDDPNGDKTYGNDLRKMVAELGLDESVVFTGWINDPRQFIKALDICVCTSIEPEPFGLVLLESMILGTPVISTRHGGPLDIIDEGVDGYFYEPKSYKQLSDLILMLLQDKKLMDSISKAATRKVIEKYDLGSIMSDIQINYDNCMTKL
ncbi:MAG: glycosyltransferase family 4 protein [Desulfuromonadales bacterium]